jgi:hypothetical protein
MAHLPTDPTDHATRANAKKSINAISALIVVL